MTREAAREGRREREGGGGSLPSCHSLGCAPHPADCTAARLHGDNGCTAARLIHPTTQGATATALQKRNFIETRNHTILQNERNANPPTSLHLPSPSPSPCSLSVHLCSVRRRAEQGGGREGRGDDRPGHRGPDVVRLPPLHQRREARALRIPSLACPAAPAAGITLGGFGLEPAAPAGVLGLDS